MYYPYVDRYEFYENLHIYIFIFLILLVLTIFVYIKLAFPFWNIQPVYHVYDFWRTIYSTPFIIHKRFVLKNITKYVDMKHVEIVPYVDATDQHKKEFVNLLQCYLLPDETSLFVFNIENLEKYFGGHLFSSYLSFYMIPNTKDYGGCISSRSGEIYIEGSLFPMYYIDFLCIKRGENTKKISRTLLQTHIYKQQYLEHVEMSKHKSSQMVLISLFRREKELLYGIVPFVRFQTNYYIINENLIEKPLPKHCILLDIHSVNMDMFLDFLEMCRTRFAAFARTDVANLAEMIKSGILYVYCLKQLDTIFAIYIFRDTRSNYETFGSVLQLVASVSNTGSQQLFIDGFNNSVRAILKKMPVYNILSVDNISNNSLLQIERTYKKINEHWSAYYLYNMVAQQKNSATSFILF